MSDMEKANLKVVNDFCEAWSTMDAEKLGAFLAENVIYRINEKTPPTNGRATVVARCKGFLAMAKAARFEVLRSSVIGNVVIDERIDHFQMSPEKETAFHVTGVFFLVNGKIAEWTDYSTPKPAK
jgi:limonene-1,2-epoxide hydrolase